MKKTILAFLVLSLVLIFSSCSNKEAGGTMADHIDIETIEKDSLNVSIEVPEKWTASSSSYFGTEIRQYMSPLEGGADNFSESISVTVEKLSEGTTLESYVESNVHALEITFQDFNIISPAANVKIGEYDGANVVFSYFSNGYSIVIDQSFVVIDGTAYIIMCNATTETYDGYKDIFEKARETFKIN